MKTPGSSGEGQLVRHPTFGLGRITELTVDSALKPVQARSFSSMCAAGKKTLILEYAHLEAV